MFENAMQYNQEGSLIYNVSLHGQFNGDIDFDLQSAKKLLDVTVLKAHEFGYDEQKPRIKETRVPPPVGNSIKDEYLDSPSPQSPNVISRNMSSTFSHPLLFQSQRSRSSKKPIKPTDDNIQSIYTFIREYRVTHSLLHSLTHFLFLGK